MYTVKKTLEISACHNLVLPYDSKCSNKHGHNWNITVWCRSKELTSYGMVIDFTHIKKLITDLLDHQDLNQMLPFNPTAENIAHWIGEQVPQCFKVEVEESTGNVAIWEED